MTRHTVCNNLKERGVNVSALTCDQLETFVQLVLHANQVTNLTAHRTIEQLFEKGIFDSLMFPLQFPSSIQYLDIGSGAGFPGIPLHLHYAFFKTTLLEPLGKKATFLKQVIHQLALENITVLQARAEIIGQQEHRQTYDVISARAVTHLRSLIELSLPLLKVGGILLAYKGSDYAIELKESQRALQLLKAKVIDIKEAVLPSGSDQRVLIIIEKEEVTDFKYPRLFSQIKHSPL